MYKGEDLKLGDWVLVPFQAHGEAEKILPAVVIEIVDKPEASFSFKIKGSGAKIFSLNYN